MWRYTIRTMKHTTHPALACCLVLGMLCLSSCGSLPNPNQTHAAPSAQGSKLLRLSAERAGSPWTRCDKVIVALAGEWSEIVPRLQPELADAGYRGTSNETYLPRLNRVVQTHKGPSGTKHVVRTTGDVLVEYNGKRSHDKTANDAAALVADAYTMFLFGADYLGARGGDWVVVPASRDHTINGKPCWLVAGTLKPGLGRAAEDRVIAWVSKSDHRLLRVQFTLNGLESTAGADADVTFSDLRRGTAGMEFPHHFVETVRRPLTAKAHEWRITSLRVD